MFRQKSTLFTPMSHSEWAYTTYLWVTHSCMELLQKVLSAFVLILEIKLGNIAWIY